MKQLLDICKKLDIVIQVEYYNKLDGIRFTAVRHYLGTPYSVAKTINTTEYSNPIFFDQFINHFSHCIECELESIHVEQILARADAIWKIDPINGIRVVTSKNTLSPLTSEEKEMICRMWEIQGIKSEVIFE